MYVDKNVGLAIVGLGILLSVVLWVILGLMGIIPMGIMKIIVLGFGIGGLVFLAVLSRLESL